jgi:ribosomal protein S6E (S10)
VPPSSRVPTGDRRRKGVRGLLRRVVVMELNLVLVAKESTVLAEAEMGSR